MKRWLWHFFLVHGIDWLRSGVVFSPFDNAAKRLLANLREEGADVTEEIWISPPAMCSHSLIVNECTKI